jgi:multidrug resistance efflux pump
MLNLSPQNRNHIDAEGLVATQMLNKAPKKLLRNTIYALLILGLIILFLPWTQNIRSNGQVLTLRPEQRPQTINALIGGRIEKWFVKEGDLVKQGDTIMFISEIKDGYFDPQLVGRSEDQLRSKELSVVSYSDKVQALDARIDALIATGKLKVQQARIKAQQAQLKLKSDSIENHAANLNYQIAKDQYERFEKLYERDLKSKTEVETRKVAMQRAQAAMIGAQQKFLQSRNDIIDAKVELSAVETKFQDEVSKAESEKFTALSSMYEAEIDVSKMQSQVANYSIRNGMYYIGPARWPHRQNFIQRHRRNHQTGRSHRDHHADQLRPRGRNVRQTDGFAVASGGAARAHSVRRLACDCILWLAQYQLRHLWRNRLCDRSVCQ